MATILTITEAIKTLGQIQKNWAFSLPMNPRFSMSG
jgi:hypothetical protein